MKKSRRLSEWFDIDVHDVDEEQEKQGAKESTQEEVLKMVDDYQKKDKTIGKALADRADKEVILSKAQEILLGNIGKLTNFLKDLINADKSGEVRFRDHSSDSPGIKDFIQGLSPFMFA